MAHRGFYSGSNPDKTILRILVSHRLTVPTEQVYDSENSERNARRFVRRIAMIPAEEMSKLALSASAKRDESPSASRERRVDKPILQDAANLCPASACAGQGERILQQTTTIAKAKISRPASAARSTTSGDCRPVGVAGTFLPCCRSPCGDRPQHHKPGRAAEPCLCRGTERGQATGQAAAAAGNQGLAAGCRRLESERLRSPVDSGGKGVIERIILRLTLLSQSRLSLPRK